MDRTHLKDLWTCWKYSTDGDFIKFKFVLAVNVFFVEFLKDRRNRRAIIIEAKKSDKESDLDKDCDKAIKQIIDEKYAEGISGYEQILCYGVAFYQKQAKVKLLKL